MIMNGAFAACENLKSVNIPETVKLIYPMAFMGCASLSSVELPEVLERIGYRAFYQTGLEEIVIPASVHDETVPDLDENGEQKKDEDGKLLTVTYMGIGYELNLREVEACSCKCEGGNAVCGGVRVLPCVGGRLSAADA